MLIARGLLSFSKAKNEGLDAHSSITVSPSQSQIFGLAPKMTNSLKIYSFSFHIELWRHVIPSLFWALTSHPKWTNVLTV